MEFKNTLFVITLAATIFGAGCSPNKPTLPSDTSQAAITALLTGAHGTEFLKEITRYDWPDEGREAGQLFDWISAAAESPDQTTAKQAGVAAHALAGFLADESGDLKDTGHGDPALIAAYSNALSPYQAAMVGDSRGTSGFEPLDNLESALPRTASVFAALYGTPTAKEQFASAAKSRAEAYEAQFAEFAATNPSLPDDRVERSYALWSARLRGLLARSEELANSDDEPAISLGATSQLRFAIVSRMVHGSDPRISEQYFNSNGTLVSPDTLKGGPLSLYNAQLINYLSTYPHLTAAVTEFDRTLNSIARA
ncbi:MULTISPECIES: hypothetical protein [unclassified Mycolicibacterium]|uniref:TPR repeat region-containing protein n=1 Tax=unclassified Mycolicibacterium TaxID=2636767 RepID=UPI0012DEF5E6|nr:MULTISPECIES: hypothetical protein [unclassified Mycolicibacterium]MUL84155.1 hypothetical protein [Mycolicibacterium sp. CBMA 329]MUL89779.1 hypothetical protein [Mycolicibacterium sp. CBMA 331]MUL99953.1 hypothetical protein [Mycolicibacterium sp. CBMA 334]MUM27106.1 hypothetical protein [Mycolicibacterium sp. CBMA 295]MUM39294.1 hypothetical protein [Mycolicibacterium sp. CBMA 247]